MDNSTLENNNDLDGKTTTTDDNTLASDAEIHEPHVELLKYPSMFTSVAESILNDVSDESIM